MKRFIIRYKELYNNQQLHTLEVLNTGSANGTVYLTGASEPFKWEEENDTSLLSFLRTKTGKISLVLQPTDDIDGLLPTSPTSHRVELDGVWIGYIQPSIFNIPMYSDSYTLKLNVKSRMSASANAQVTFAGWYKVYIKDILDNIVMADYYILPSGYDYDWWLSPLTVNPYRTDNDFKFDSGETLYEQNTAYNLLNEFCSLFRFNVHEIPYNGGTAYLFCDYNYDGNYLVYDIEDPETPQVITAGEIDFYDTFQLAGGKNNIQMIRPQRKVILIDSGERNSESRFPFALSKYTGLGWIDGQRAYYLRPMASQLTSQYLRTQPSEYQPSGMNVVMCGRGKDGDGNPEECIYLDSVSPNTKILSARFYGLVSPGSFMIEFDEIPSNLAYGNYIFRYSIQCGSQFWDDENTEWSSTESIYSATIDSQNKKIFSVGGFSYDANNEGQPIIINLYATTVEQSITCKITDIVVYDYALENIPDKYNQNLYGRKDLQGPVGADEETEVSSIFGITTTTNHSIDYMFDNQKAITVEVVRKEMTISDYIRKWTFDDDTLKYRLISVQDSMRDSTMELMFIGCETIS